MVWIVLGLVIAGLVYIYVQTYLIDITQYNLTIPKLKETMRGKKIVHISDMHFRPATNKSYVETILDKIESLRPDYIMITGDLVQAGLDDFSDVPLRHFMEECSKMAKTYVVTGNHDIQSGPFEDFSKIITASNATLLLDEAVTLPDEEGSSLVLMGLAERKKQSDLPQPILKSIELSKEMERMPKILLAHRPEFFDHYMYDRTKMPDLVLSGHTHAGQVRAPILGGLFAPGQGVLPKYDYGYFTYSEDPTKRLIISRGLGNSSFPIRVNNRPEIVLVTLN